MARQVSIDVFSDPACPWCLVGLSRLDRAIAALPDGVAVDITHHPYLLDANVPREGTDVVELLRRKYGQDPFEMWDRLENEAQLSGVALNMRKQKMRYPSQPAEGLIAAARDKGTQHALARALGDAYYLEARDISDPAVLADVAAPHGFQDAEVREIVADAGVWQAIEQASASAAQQGVQGVPFFIFGRQYALSGAQPEAVFAQAFEQVLAEA